MEVTDEMAERLLMRIVQRTSPYSREMVERTKSALEAALSSQWRSVSGYMGQYEVSGDGIIRKITGEIVGQWVKDGYLFARLTDPATGSRDMVRTHRIVAEAFCQNAGSKPYVNHIDNNPLNNCASNLEWCTQQENLAHMDAQGRRVNSALGKRAATAALTDSQASEIRREYAAGTATYEQLSSKYGVSKRSIGRLIEGINYKPLPAPPSSTEAV